MSHKVYKQDCTLGLAQKVKSGSVKFVFADPPYNIGQEYDTYNDSKARNEYLDWCEQWIPKVHECLTDDGGFMLMIGDAFVSELDVICKSHFGFYKRHHIIWHFTFGQHHSKALQSSHVHILYYTKHKSKRTFNVDDPEVRVMSARQLVGDKRANPDGKPPATVWVLHPSHMPEAFDPTCNTWLFSRLCGTFKSKEKGMPNQLPVALVERCVRLCSNEGDLVVDPFVGTGTTGEACVNLGRQFVGFDISENCVKASRRRIKAAEKCHGRQPDEDKTLFDV